MSPQDNHSPRPVVGITGGIGSGKSTVARMLEEEADGRVVDADQLAREAHQKPGIQEEIQTVFGEEFVSDGSVNRKKLAEEVFEDEEKLNRLNEIIHPYVLERIQDEVTSFRENETSGPELLILDVPLLLETDLDHLCDVLLHVEVPEDVRARRLRESRNWDRDELRNREKTQMDVGLKQKKADYIIDNSRSKEATRKQLKRLLPEIINPDGS